MEDSDSSSSENYQKRNSSSDDSEGKSKKNYKKQNNKSKKGKK